MTPVLQSIPDQVRDDDESKFTLNLLRPQKEPIWTVYPQRRHLLTKVRLLIDKLREELPGGVAAERTQLAATFLIEPAK